MPRLIISPGQRDELTIDLSDGTNTIGRGRDAKIRVVNKSLSRQHARILIGTGGPTFLIDLDSKNGTFISGERIRKHQLSDGDEFVCGDVSFEFRSTDFAVAPPSTILREIPAQTAFMTLNRDVPREPYRADPTQPHMSWKAPVEPPPPPPARETAEDRLRVMLEVSQLLSSPEGIDEQLAKILDLALRILDVDRAAVILIDEQTGEFTTPVVESKRGTDDHGETQIYSKHVLNYVRERNVAALFSDAASDPRLEGAQSIYIQSIRSSMCAPLKSQDRFLGAIYVDNLTTVEAFTEQDLELLSAFAAQSAVSLDNARLYQRLQSEAVTRNNLLRFFPPTTIAELMSKPSLTVEAQDVVVTAMFCDISGFTAMSAHMRPREVVALLNRYFPVMTEAVFAEEGTLEKYIGDALLAVWGAPFHRDDDADRALRAAVAMQHAMVGLNAMLDFAEPLHIHIGLNTGPVAAGNIGSPHYLQYATIGDATNLASRICGVATDGEIAIGEPTYNQLSSHPWPLVGPQEVMVKGRDEPLKIWKVVWNDGRLSDVPI